MQFIHNFIFGFLPPAAAACVSCVWVMPYGVPLGVCMEKAPGRQLSPRPTDKTKVNPLVLPLELRIVLLRTQPIGIIHTIKALNILYIDL